jgi:hypothetical protein
MEWAASQTQKAFRSTGKQFMKWLEARHLDSRAESTGAHVRLSEIVAQLVRASAARIAEFDFPTVLGW